MSLSHAVVWIDHVVAHVQHFDAKTSVLEDVMSTSEQPHLHVKSGIPGSGRSMESASYFEAIAVALGDASAILVVGPASEKLEFQKYLIKLHPHIAQKIVAVEAIDHPTNGETLRYARQYFKHADAVR